MKVYKIKEKLTEITKDEIFEDLSPYVVLVNWEEYQEEVKFFGFEEDLDDLSHIRSTNATRAEVFYDSIIGNFSIPDRKNIMGDKDRFSFILDDRGVVFIDDGNVVLPILAKIMLSKKWRKPSHERFWFDFLEMIIKDDLPLLEKFEKEMDEMEDSLFHGELEGKMERIADIRSEIGDLRVHYEQLTDLVQEFQENENVYFKEENLRYISLLGNRIGILKDILASLREHTLLIREIYRNQLDEQQNKLMSLLTVVATIFMPLTLLAGWYGMNFINMPELTAEWGYPGIIILSIVVIIVEIIIFKKKKWL